MNSIPEERCSCNARPKHKCSKESTVGGGKMCIKDLKEEAVTLFANLVPEDSELDVCVHQVGKLKSSTSPEEQIQDGLHDLEMHFLKSREIIYSLEDKGVKMRTIKDNLEFLIDGLGEWRENNDHTTP